MAKYSIILPVRNGGEYVKDCISSILKQTLNDFNVIVLDNSSTDSTVAWIQSLNDDRIIIYRSDKLLSIEENWARILTIPKNEFITLIGHDDTLDVEYLSVMDNLIQKHPNASLYLAHFRYIDSKGSTIRLCKPMDEIQSAPEFLALFLSNTIDSMGTGHMMRSGDYDAVGGIPVSYPNLLFADFELWINLAKKSYKATAFRECFAFRLHQSTTTTSPDLKFHQAFASFIGYLKKLQQSDKQLAEVISRYAIGFIDFYCKGLAHRLLRTPKNKRNGQTVASFLGQCKEYADILVPDNNFDPCKRFSVRLAKKIDSNFFTRFIFRGFKKINPRPVYS